MTVTTHRRALRRGDHASANVGIGRLRRHRRGAVGPGLAQSCPTSGTRRGDRVLDGRGLGQRIDPGSHGRCPTSPPATSDASGAAAPRLQARAAAAGLELGWREANAEALPFTPANSMRCSTIRVMFALGVISAPPTNWPGSAPARRQDQHRTNPEGFYANCRPPSDRTGRRRRSAARGGGRGSEDYVSGPALRPCVRHPYPARGSPTVDRFGCPDECGYFKNFYGPAINAASGSIADSPGVRRHTRRRNHRTLSRIPCDGVMQ